MKIKQFCLDYMDTADQLKEKFLKDNLEITNYIPFAKKDALAQILADISTYKYEDYIKEDGTTGRRKTNTIHVNSTGGYIFFCRSIIENYTNLEAETVGFFDEYDLLKQSGLLDKLIVGDEKEQPLIPMEEISELRTLIDMKKKDAMTNYSTPQSYIATQVERVSTIIGVTLKPVFDKISDQIKNLDEKDIERLGKAIERAVKKIK